MEREAKSKKQTIRSVVPLRNIIPLGKESCETAFKICCRRPAVLKKAETVLDTSPWYFMHLGKMYNSDNLLSETPE